MDYWYILIIAIVCALFSSQIDSLLGDVIKSRKARNVLYGVVSCIMLAIIGVLIYSALSGTAYGSSNLFLVLGLSFLFVIGIIVGKLCVGRHRKTV